MLWQMRSSQLSRRDMAYLLPDLHSTVIELGRRGPMVEAPQPTR